MENRNAETPGSEADRRAISAIQTLACMIEGVMLELCLHMPDKRLQELDGGWGGFVYKGLAGEAVMGPGGHLKVMTAPNGNVCYLRRASGKISLARSAEIWMSRLFDELRSVLEVCEHAR